MLERAGRFDLLAHELRVGSLRRMLRKLGGPRAAAALDGEVEGDELLRLSRDGLRLFRARVDPGLWTGAFDDTRIEDGAALEQLGRSLESLEKSVAGDGLLEDTPGPADPRIASTSPS